MLPLTLIPKLKDERKTKINELNTAINYDSVTVHKITALDPRFSGLNGAGTDLNNEKAWTTQIHV